MSVESYTPKKIEFTYEYDGYSVSDDSPFDFEALGLTKDPGCYDCYRDYEVDTKYDYKVYDTYEYYTPVDAFNDIYTKDYLADSLGFDSLGIVPKVYETDTPAKPAKPVPPKKIVSDDDMKYTADFFDL